MQKKIILKALAHLEQPAPKLEQKDIDFIRDLADKRESYPISVKQNSWLNDIWGKIS